MITGELKNKIDGLWDVFAASGIVEPLSVIEQITYLMFIRDLDDADNKRAKESAMLGLPYQSIFTNEVKIGDTMIDGTQLKWSVFRDFPADRMYSVMQEWVFPFIKTLHNDKDSAYSKYMDDAIFKLPTPLVLSKVVDALDEIYAMMNEMQTADVRGDVYEYLLSKIAKSGLIGQFRTPRHIIRMMVIVLFLLCILTVLRFVPHVVTFFAVFIGVFLCDRKIFCRINYGLLIKFIILFIVVGDVAQIPWINKMLSTMIVGNEVAGGILISQIVSNVPAAILIARFTSNGNALLLGVNIGGLGTLIASMASMISLDYYEKSIFADKKAYILSFTKYNILFLLIEIVLVLLLL